MRRPSAVGPAGRSAATIAGAIALVVASYGCGSRSSVGSETTSAGTTQPPATRPYTTPARARAASPLGRQQRTSGCQARGQLPDPACTPGGVFPQATTAEICQSGYTQRVRNVLPSTKDAVFAAYGISAHRAGQYEIDHLVPLELGGNNTRANLWPEIAPGYGEKDTVENELHAAVCSGRTALRRAQEQIASDWRHAGAPVPAGLATLTQRSAPGRHESPPSSPSADTTFCTTHPCIANFDNGRGSIVQCADGEYSHSGGLPGVCNRHGGVR